MKRRARRKAKLFRKGRRSDTKINFAESVGLRVSNSNLIYPIGEKVPVMFKVLVNVEIGKYHEEIPMFVANINDNCLLDIDFLKKVNLEKFFESFSGILEYKKERTLTCSYVEISSEKVSPILEKLYKENSEKLNQEQKKTFFEFLMEFRDVFSENIITGNCDIVNPCYKCKKFSPY